MDELKKDGFSSEEEKEKSLLEEIFEEPSFSEDEEEKDDLARELEDIRDMFQQELDKNQEQGDEEGMLIQELEGDSDLTEDEDIQEIAPEDLCQCCEEKIRFKELDEDYPYCEDCRNAMKKYPLRKSGVLTFLIAIVLFFASFWFSYPYLSDTITIVNASTNYNSGNVMSALQEYHSYFSGAKTGEGFSKRAFDEILEGYCNLGYQTNAAQLIGNFYTDEDLKKPQNKKYASIINEATILTETYEAVSLITEDALSGKDFNYDKLASELDALKNVNPKQEGKSEVTEKYNEVFIEYYKYILMSIKELSLEQQLEQLKHIDSIGAGQEWVYLSNYCAVAAKLGDEEAVNYSFDKLLSINKEDSTAYISKANLYRFGVDGKPEPDKIIEICNQAEAAFGVTDVSYKHPLAIAYLLKGEGTLALEAIESLFSAGNYTVQNCNLYALCALYNGDEQIYKDMKELLSSYGYEISELVTQYKNDKITVEEIIKDKGGDI